MIVTHQIVRDCSHQSAADCSDEVLAALGHGPGFALRADTPTDTVHGSVMIAHNDPPIPHEITVEIYETDDLPSAKLVRGVMVGRQATLKRPDVMPSDDEIKAKLTAMTTKVVTP